MTLEELIAAHRMSAESMPMSWRTVCTCGWSESVKIADNDLAVEIHAAHVAAEIRKVYAVVKVPVVAHKGPFDTDASYLRDAAERIEGGYLAGGSNVSNAVAHLLRDVATAAEVGG